MIDESCKVPRENLDDGFNPCRKQVVENGELCQYAHMYDVMNERYDREDETSYLNSVKRDKITSTTPVLLAGNNTQIYANSTNGEGRVNMLSSASFINPDNHTEASIPSAKAVADYAPIPLPVSKGGTGGNTPYVTNDLDNSATFVMYDEQNVRYNAAPMTLLSGYLNNRYSALVPTKNLSSGADLDGLEYGTYFTSDADASNSLVNRPNHTFQSSVRVEQFANGAVTDTKAQVISENFTGTTFYRSVVNGVWKPWTQLYPTSAPTVPNPLPVDQGGTGAQKRSLKTAAGLTLLPVIDSIGASGALNGYTSVTNIATFITTNNIRPEITAAFENHTADAVAHNDLLPTNALMMDYVDAHSMETPPDKFSFAVSPVPTGTWDGEMTINVVPVFARTIGSVTYVVARVYGSKMFYYTGSADNVDLFLGLKPVGEYTSTLNSSTNIPLTLRVSGRSYTSGTYGFTPNGSAANLSLNNQIVSSVFNLGDFNISNNLKCVFGEGTNTPAVTVSVNCMALMW